MLGIKDIGVHIPELRISNYEKRADFAISEEFIENKLGVKAVSRMEPGMETSDLCYAAYESLIKKNKDLDPMNVDVVIVCTQNPDYTLPHTSAIIHGKLNLPKQCAAFDISLGCSGYVYGLAVIESLMTSMDMKCGLLFTADPYSKIIDEADRNTSLLFGDAASVTYIGQDPVLISGKFTFGTQGKGFDYLISRNNKLAMNGREIFNFAARTVPEDIRTVLKLNKLTIDEVDKFLLHQASKYIIDFLVKRVGLPRHKTPYEIETYGNTVSSSIPIMLERYLENKEARTILISGFGVGLSWASGILIRSGN